MRSMSRALAVLAAAGLAVPVWAVPAHAETVTETGFVGAYYLFSNPGVIGGDIEGNPIGGQAGPTQTKSTDGVAEDDLAVAVVAAGSGQPDKFSALQFALFDLLPGSTVSQATLVVPISTNPNSRQTPVDPKLVVACAVGNEGIGDADGAPMQDAPSVKCSDNSMAAKSIDGGKAFEFDVTAIAQKWVDFNSGLALYPSEAGFARPFQTVFAPKDQARLTLSFIPPAEEEFVDDLGDTTFDDTTFDDTTFDDGAGAAGFDSGSFDSGTTTFEPLDTPAIASGDTPAPSVADEGSGAQPVTRASSFSTPMAFDGLTWLAILGGAALLAVVSLALGAPTTGAAAATATRPGGVASTLASRRGVGLGSGLRPV